MGEPAVFTVTVVSTEPASRTSSTGRESVGGKVCRQTAGYRSRERLSSAQAGYGEDEGDAREGNHDD